MGIDVGGTKTRCLISRNDGTALAYGETGPGSHEVVGYEGLKSALAKVTKEALAMSGLGISDISGLGAGMAGYDWPSERADHLEIVKALGVKGPIVLKNDAALGLAAIADEGINLSSGTSNNCYGLWQGKEGSLAGAGFLSGEEGGGLEVAILATRAVNHARIKRSPETRLSVALPKLEGFKNADDFIEAIAKGRLFPKAEWAPLVFLTAREGDITAQNIIERSANELALSALAVMNQLGIDKKDLPKGFTLVMSGSLFSLEPSMALILEPLIRAHAPNMNFVRLNAPPVCGAIMFVAQELAMNTGGLRPKLLETASMISKN